MERTEASSHIGVNWLAKCDFCYMVSLSHSECYVLDPRLLDSSATDTISQSDQINKSGFNRQGNAKQSTPRWPLGRQGTEQEGTCGRSMGQVLKVGVVPGLSGGGVLEGQLSEMGQGLEREGRGREIKAELPPEHLIWGSSTYQSSDRQSGFLEALTQLSITELWVASCLHKDQWGRINEYPVLIPVLLSHF